MTATPSTGRTAAEGRESGRITPPWTAIQCADLNAFQRSGQFHPFTCGGDRGDAAHYAYAAETGDPDLGLLVAHPDGWRCPVCGYRQAWAHASMAAPVLAPPVTPGDLLLRTEITVTRERLREVLDMDEDEDKLDPVIPTCAGEWRREAADLWRAWDHDEDAIERADAALPSATPGTGA